MIVWFGNGGSKVPPARIRADRFHADAEHIAIVGQELRRVGGEAGAVRAVGGDVQEETGPDRGSSRYASGQAPAGILVLDLPFLDPFRVSRKSGSLSQRAPTARTARLRRRRAQFLAHDRDVLGVGVETVGTDAGQAGTFDRHFRTIRSCTAAGKFGLASLCNLDSAATAGRGGHRRAAEDRARQRQPVRVLAIHPAGLDVHDVQRRTR